MGELVFELTWFTPLQTDHVSATQRHGARAHPVLRGSLFRGPLRSRPQKSSTLCETLRTQRAERSHTCSFDPFRSSFGSLDRRATRPARRRLSLLPKPRRRACRRQTRRQAVEKSCKNAGFGVTVACETGSRAESTYSDEWVHWCLWFRYFHALFWDLLSIPHRLGLLRSCGSVNLWRWSDSYFKGEKYSFLYLDFFFVVSIA